VAEIHLLVGLGMIVLNAIAGLWGAVAWARRRPSIWFWFVLRSAQGAVIVQVLLGALLLVAGRDADDAMHYVYGTFPLPVNLFAEGMRIGAAQREVGDTDFERLGADEQRAIALRIVRREMAVMSIAALLIVAFGVRAAQVSSEF
jgi:hypothetical protein